MPRRSTVTLLTATALLCGCGPQAPPSGPEETCVLACRTTAAQCSRDDCARGCELVLDRLVEHEGDHVIACVGEARTSCDARRWARCAALVGPYADGGPPAPPPRRDDTDDVE